MAKLLYSNVVAMSLRLFACSVSLVLLSSLNSMALADGANGRWRGTWSSNNTGHRGPLRASIRQTNDGSYRAFFVGRFAGVVPFAYRADLHPIPGAPGAYSSVKRLPLLGDYHMQATVSATTFWATFRGGQDVGVFQMQRRR